MKQNTIISALIIFTLNFNAFSQEITFVKGGRISFEGKTIQRPADMLAIISQKNSPELIPTFNKFKSNRGASMALGYIGGFGLGYSLSNALFSGNKINGGLLAGSAGVSIISLILGNSANNSLKKVVELYNSTEKTKITFQPSLKNDSGFTNLGISVKF